MRLYGAELLRLRSRRAVALLLLATVVLVALVAGSTAWNTRPVSDADRAAAQAEADREAEQGYVQQDLRACEADPAAYGAADAAECADFLVPQADWFLGRQSLDLEAQREDGGISTLVLLLGAAALVGATFAGADWTTGSMANQLLAEPRRTRVWATKAAALLTCVVVGSVVVLAALWGFYAALAGVRGIDSPDGLWTGVGGDMLRGVVLAAATGLGTFSLAMLLRNTGATVALLFLVSAVGEILISSLPFEGTGRWSPSNNLFAVLLDGHEVYDYSLPCPPNEIECDQTYVLTLGDGALYLGVLLAVAVLVSLWSFRRRDVP